MKKLIHNLRQKPPHVRRMVSLGVSAIFTFALGLIWLSSLVAVSLQTSEEKKQDDTPSPFAAIWNEIKSFGEEVGNQMAEVSTAFKFADDSNPEEYAVSVQTVATSTDGTIGVGVDSASEETSSINSTTE